MRRAALALVAVVALAACVERDPSTVDVPPPSSTATTAVGLPSTTTTRPATTRRIIVGGTDAVPDAVVPATTTAPPAPAPPTGGPGRAAHDVLGPGPFTRLAVQVLTQDGAEPRQATLDRVVDVLASASGKPVATMGGTVPVQRRWGSDLVDAARQRAPRVADGTLLLQLAFVHGQSAQGPDVLGISLTSTLSAVFVDQVDASATGLVSPGTIERAVAVHELGHLLGLVDLVLRTGRADPEHPGHSTNRRSVMYWAVESTLVGDLLTGGPPQDFDAADLADLRRIAAGG